MIMRDSVSVAGSRRLGGCLAALMTMLLLAACGSAGGATVPATPAVATAPNVATAVSTGSATPSATAGNTAPSGTVTPVPSATTTATSGSVDPRGAAPAKRGGGGTLHLLYWQAPTTLSVTAGSVRRTRKLPASC